MSCIDYERFGIYYQRKHDAEKRAMDEAKRGTGRHGRSF